MPERERISWVALIVNIIIPVWYFRRILSLPADADLFGPRTAAFAMSLVAAAIVISIGCEILLRIVQRGTGGGGDAAVKDERDELINLKATRNAHGILVLAVILVLGQTALLEWRLRHWHAPPRPGTVLELLGTGPLQAMHVAQLLLLALTLATIALNASRIFYYRRGY